MRITDYGLNFVTASPVKAYKYIEQLPHNKHVYMYYHDTEFGSVLMYGDNCMRVRIWGHGTESIILSTQRDLEKFLRDNGAIK